MQATNDYRNTYAEIRLDHLRFNCRQLKSLQPEEQFFCPMVKGDAYGHGAVAVVKALMDEGVKHFGVALVEEAVKLREANLDDCEILVFGHFNGSATAAIREYNLTPVIHNWRQLESLEKAASFGVRQKIHVKFDSGMHRLGFDPKEAQRLAEYLKNHSHFLLGGLCTHLAAGEDILKDDGHSRRQIATFIKALDFFSGHKGVVHVFNSSALMGHHWLKQWDWGSRPGIALYGVKPDLDTANDSQSKWHEEFELKPVMRLRSEIVATHEIGKGESVSYGGTWTAPCRSQIGVVSLGYADGYPRVLSNRAQMNFRGFRVNVVGTVCMDYTLLDLTEITDGHNGVIGEPVVVFGDEGSEAVRVEEVAKLSGTIAYEVLSGIGPRVPRKIIGS